MGTRRAAVEKSEEVIETYMRICRFLALSWLLLVGHLLLLAMHLLLLAMHLLGLEPKVQNPRVDQPYMNKGMLSSELTAQTWSGSGFQFTFAVSRSENDVHGFTVVSPCFAGRFHCVSLCFQ